MINQDWTREKNWELNPSLPHSLQELNTSTITAASQSLHSQEWEVRSQRQKSIPDMPWDADNLVGKLNTVLETT